MFQGEASAFQGRYEGSSINGTFFGGVSVIYSTL